MTKPSGDHGGGPRISRRRALTLSTSALGSVAVGLAGASCAQATEAVSPEPAPTEARRLPLTAESRASIDAAVGFLSEAFDRYGSGTTLRLPQSYTGGYFAGIGFVSSFTYDDALTVIAWLSSGSADDLARARTLGDTLIHAQTYDPIGDGRTRASYQPDPFVAADGSPVIGSAAANTGNQSWLGMALVHLYHRTGVRRYLTAALRLADWIQTITWSDAASPHGYTGGRSETDAPYPFKSTEHNIDVGAFFAMLGTVTHDSTWARRSKAAFAFVSALRDESSGHLWTGTDADGSTTNTTPVPEDVQTWALLATGERKYITAVDWAADALAAADGQYTGVSYSDADVSKVWFEGTAHLALSFERIGGAHARARATALLATLRLAQSAEPNGDGKGITAASSDGLATGFGDLYYASLHTGATAWYVLAARNVNPFVLA